MAVRRHRRSVAILAAGLALLCAIYAGLSVYKAIWYTTTPPQPPITRTPGDDGLWFREVSFPSAASEELRLTGWLILHRKPRGAIIFAHGRYANRAAHLALARPLWEAGYTVLLFDLRGHGESASAPCTYGLREQWDIVGAVRFLQAQPIQPGAIGVIGWSLGGASALMAAAQTDDIAAVVVDSAYADAEPLLAQNALRPGLALALRAVRGVDLSRVRPEAAVGRLDGRPVLLIHGTEDRAVPVSHAARLQAAADGSARLWIVPGAGHVQGYATDPDRYVERVLTFFAAALARPG